jgi:predicted component of type VI protein secretion system
MKTYFEHVSRGPELEIVEFNPPPDAEAAALRVALVRLQQDASAMQKALRWMTDDRDHWCNSYMKTLRDNT